MKPEELVGQRVALALPDGEALYFSIAALVPYAGEAYAVLEQEQKDGQLLITSIEPDEEGVYQFVVMHEEDVIAGVLEKFVARNISLAMEGLSDQEEGCGCEGVCGCGHIH